MGNALLFLVVGHAVPESRYIRELSTLAIFNSPGRLLTRFGSARAVLVRQIPHLIYANATRRTRKRLAGRGCSSRPSTRALPARVSFIQRPSDATSPRARYRLIVSSSQ